MLFLCVMFTCSTPVASLALVSTKIILYLVKIRSVGHPDTLGPHVCSYYNK